MWTIWSLIIFYLGKKALKKFLDSNHVDNNCIIISHDKNCIIFQPKKAYG